MSITDNGSAHSTAAPFSEDQDPTFTRQELALVAVFMPIALPLGALTAGYKFLKRIGKR